MVSLFILQHASFGWLGQQIPFSFCNWNMSAPLRDKGRLIKQRCCFNPDFVLDKIRNNTHLPEQSQCFSDHKLLTLSQHLSQVKSGGNLFVKWAWVNQVKFQNIQIHNSNWASRTGPANLLATANLLYTINACFL